MILKDLMTMLQFVKIDVMGKFINRLSESQFCNTSESQFCNISDPQFLKDDKIKKTFD